MKYSPPTHSGRFKPWTLGSGALALLVGLPLLTAVLEGCRPAPHGQPTSTATDTSASPAPGPPSHEPAGGSASEPEPDGRPAVPVEDAIPLLKPVSQAELANYVGAGKCVTCHTKEAGQLEGHHAHTLSWVTAETHGELFRKPNDVFDPALKIRYQARVKNGKCIVRAEQGEKQMEVEAGLAFGSGNTGFTYLGLMRGQPVELRLTYYRRADKWDIAAGQQIGTQINSPVGDVLDTETLNKCFQCHTTALVQRKGRPDPQASIFGITCEACHGPGKAHIEAVQRGERDHRMVRLADYRDQLTVRLCGQCHRTETSQDFHAKETQNQLPRLQGPALAASRCFKESRGKLSCLTCHDPHRNTDQTTRADYNKMCGSCHTPAHPTQVACKARPQGDCVSCHMPLQAVNMPTRPEYRTHWIKVWSREAKGR